MVNAHVQTLAGLHCGHCSRTAHKDNAVLELGYLSISRMSQQVLLQNREKICDSRIRKFIGPGPQGPREGSD